MNNLHQGHINMLAAIVAKNNAGELSAIAEYSEVLATPGFPPEFYADIREIISDEMNHSERLTNWYTRLTGIVAART